MPATPLTIYCNAKFPDHAINQLKQGVGPHRLLLSTGFPVSASGSAANLTAGTADPLLGEADIAFGQPDTEQVIQLSRLRWVHLTTAGYTRYDTDAMRTALRARNAALTNSSMVYDEPCAEHAMAMILAMARQLPQSHDEQDGDRAWRSAQHRIKSRLLEGQSIVILGFGAIARRLIELLAPYHMKISAIRRHVKGNESVPTYEWSKLAELLPDADHIMNILPAAASTERAFDAKLLALLKPSSYFYNIGRGTTVDQAALVQILNARKIAGAYLDVTDPEPLPKDHPLWTAPNTYITPHTAGGQAHEVESLVEHFLTNLKRFEKNEPLNDRVI
jgi:phosphoglycerate dehydrogenase-like enzyme